MIDPLAKLRAAGIAAQDARAIWAIKAEIRNALIVAALEEGYEQKRVADAAKLAAPTVMAIAARFDNQQEQFRTPE